MEIFKYGEKETEYLKKQDKKLAAAIDEIGIIEREVIPDPFTALISSIVSQQISSKAAKTVWGRLEDLLGGITPANIAGTKIEDIKKCGISGRKADYIQGIAHSAISGEVDFKALHNLADKEIINTLTKLRGVGVWTVEMLLIFSLERPDVVSYNDLAIRRGMINLYEIPEISREAFQEYRNRYSPFGSVASLYLWRLSA